MTEKDKTVEEIEIQEQESAESAPENSKKNKSRKNKKGKGDAAVEKIEQLEGDLKDLKDKYLRLFAEFDNYKKRTIKEKLDLMKTAAQDTLESLLPVLDDFDRAKKTADDENTNETFSEGVAMVYNKLYTALHHHGLRPMESNGQEFDPELHEAITEIPAPSEDLKGKVIDTIEKGYYLNDKIIRYAKVVVGK
jgi:molecular chaperone GrpE